MFLNLAYFLVYNTPLFYFIQSVWRDEAFSFFMAQPGIFQIIKNTATDFNPPLYYLLLHFWIWFAGNSDVKLRLLSFIFHLITVYFAYLLNRKIFSQKFAIFGALCMFLNPMLLYYAFELRMYSLFSMFTMISFYYFYCKKWNSYLISTIFGLYTHTFFIIVPVSYAIYYFVTKQLNIKKLINIFKPVIFFIPWIPVIVNQFLRSKNSWIFPVDFQLIRSVLGNLFTSYEGTPGNWWILTSILSLILIVLFLIGLKRKRLVLMFLVPIFFPLFVILSYSVIIKPIFVNRYVIFITVFEILASTLGIWCIKNRKIRIMIGSFWIFSLIIMNISMAPFKKKTDFKTSFAEINSLSNNKDYIYAQTPIGFLESAYYYKYKDKVFVYNPNNIEIPNYIGVTVLFPKISKSAYPASSRTFLIHDDASYEMVINK
jgi:mannosyltransferase